MSTRTTILSRLRQLPTWLWDQTFAKIENLEADSEGSLRYANDEVEPDEANLICSKVSESVDGVVFERWNDELHIPMWDIDMELYVRETSPGKFHLAINKQISRERYEAITRTLVAAGIVQRGWADSSYSSALGGCLRPPWVSKEEQEQAKASAYGPRTVDF
jgi:hypothetical protein